jgi:cell pole-organizing protein PopZ
MTEPRLPHTAAWKDPFDSITASQDHHKAEPATGGDTVGGEPSRPGPLPSEYAPGSRRSLGGSDVDGSAHKPRLLSQEAENAVGDSFGNLAQTIIAQNIKVLDAHMSTVVRGHVQQWLNSNLPLLVERLVRSEIERIARTR